MTRDEALKSIHQDLEAVGLISRRRLRQLFDSHVGTAFHGLNYGRLYSCLSDEIGLDKPRGFADALFYRTPKQFRHEDSRTAFLKTFSM